MSINVPGPDGSIVEFPDGTSQETINAEMTKAFGNYKEPTERLPSDVVARDAEGTTVHVADTPVEGVEVVAARKVKPPVDEAPPPPSHKETTGEFLKGTLGAFGEGLTLNYSDEMQAALITGHTSGPEYEKVRDELRNKAAYFSQQHPITSGIAKLGGGIAPFLIPGVGELAAFGRLGMAGKVGANMALGALQGGVSGYGAAEDKGSPEGMFQTAESAFLGGALAPVVMAAPSVLRGFGNMVRPATGQRAREIALDLSTKALQQDQQVFPLTRAQIDAERAQGIPSGRGKMPPAPMTPEARMRADQDAGIPSTYGETAGSNTASLAEQAMITPGAESKQLLDATLRAQQGAKGRVKSTINTALTGGQNYDAARRDIAQELREIYASAYEPAFVNPATGAEREVSNSAITNILGTRTVSPFWSEAGKLAQGEADRIAAQTGLPAESPLRNFLVPIEAADGSITGYTVKPGLRPTVRALDYLKRAMDDARDAGFRKGDLSAERAKQLQDITKSLTDALETAVPAYGDALKLYGGGAKVRSALDAGMGKGSWSVDDATTDAVRLRLEGDPARNIKPMSTAEREALRVGYGSMLLDEIRRGANSRNVAGRIIKEDGRVEKLEMLFDDPAKFDAFRAGLEREAELFAQRGRQLGGSDTVRRSVARDAIANAVDAGDFNRVPDLLRQGVSGNWLGAGRILLNMAQRAGGGPEVYEQIANIMRTGSPTEVAQLMRQMSERSARVAREVRGQARQSSGMVRGEAAMLGRSPSLSDAQDPEEAERNLRPVEKDEAPPVEAPPAEGVDAEPASYTPDNNPDVDEYIRAITDEKVEGTGKNPRSNAEGYGQFVDATFVDTYRQTFPDQAELSKEEILSQRGTGVEEAMMVTLTRNNLAILKNKNLEPSKRNVYLMHHFGYGGGPAVIEGDPRTPLIDVVGKKVIAANPQFEGMTVGDARNWAANYIKKANT